MKGMLMQPRIIGCLLLLGLVLSFGKAEAQTDTDFWFVVPYTTNQHGGGKPALLTVSTYNMASTITISMPANSSFTPIVQTVAPNTAYTFTLTDFVKNAAKPSIENNGLNATNPNNCALHITATTPITAYYNIANTNNTEIYALKGKNALGQKFYVPFESVRNNHDFGSTDPSYSTINIVATKDNTSVNITPTKDAYALGQKIPAGTTKTIILKRGQCIAVMPALISNKPDLNGANHLGGTLVTSNNDVAITINDDSINNKSGGNYDTLGDQIVNLESLGKTYVVLRTQAQTNNTSIPEANPINDTGEDIAYVLATEDNTTVTFRNNEGGTVTTTVLNAGQQALVKTAGKYCIIEADKKVSVWHVGGFGGELGGAILPAVDKCTGSTQVAFHKLQESGKTFNTNIMVRTNGKDKFLLNGIPINFETAAGGTWTQVGTSDWWFLQVNNWTTGKFPSLKGNAGNVLTNTGDLFHFGVFYGASSGGCNYGYFSDFNELKIAGAVAGVDAGETKVCFGVPIQLYAQGGTSYKWTPGRYLSDSTVYNPIANVPNSGTQSYKVVVSGLCNMKDSATINLQIYPPVVANFAVDKITGCSPLDVNFENTSMNATILEWQFGDGKDTTSADPTLVNKFSHRYVNNTADSITYVVTLMVKGSSGCGDIIQKEITVYPAGDAKFSRDPDAQYCSPRAIVFHNDSDIGVQDPANITYIWDYGDGYSENVGTSTADVSHNFSSLGRPKLRHDVSLTLINNFGCKTVATDTVDVYGKVEANFALDKISICPKRKVSVPNVELTVTDNSTGVITSKSWGNSWDGWTGTPNVGLALPSTPFTEKKTYIGETSEVTTLTLTVTGNGGCTDAYTKDVTINPYVKADFAIDKLASVCDGDVINITNNSSAGSASFVWDYGDGITSIVDSPVTAANKNSSHTYENPTSTNKTYLINLVAKSDAGGCADTSKRAVTVYSRITPKFTMNTPRGCAPILSTITNASDGNVTDTYEWSSGEGDAASAVVTYAEFSTDKNPAAQSFTNTSSAIKDYTVKLTITSKEGGCTAEATRLVRVYPQPTANFKVDTEKGCNPLPVKFTIENPASVATYDYFWSFGDGATSDKVTGISHEYNNFDAASDNTFTSSLEVSNIYGCSSTFTKDIEVHPYLKSSFTAEQTDCTPVDVTITPTAQGATAYNWTLSGGTVVSGDVTDGNPFTVRYDNNGTTDLAPTISLIATNAGGVCSATSATATINVVPKLVADGSFVVDKCTGDAKFTNASTGYSQYVWDFGDGETSSATTSPLAHTYLNRSAASKNYTAILTVKNKLGCTENKKLAVGVAPRVESSFAFDITEKCTPVKLNITNTSLNGTEFFWSYGGGAADETRTTKAPFEATLDNIDPNAQKTYTIALRAQDATTGCESTSSQLVTVQPKVIAAMDYAVADKCTGAINFTNKSTGGSSYTWAYGDATSAYTTTVPEGVSHTYLNRSADNKTFTATLTVNNALGCSNVATKAIGIVPRVESSFTLDIKEKCTPMVISLTNTSLNGTTFAWDYGHTIGGIAQKEVRTDKAAFDLTVDSESPNNIQTYPITLVTTDAATLCSATSTANLEVYPRVVAAMSHTVADKCSGAIDFANASTGAINYTWQYNDGTSAYKTTTLEGVSHVYLNRDGAPKTFSPTLTATNALGCINTMTEAIDIVPRVESHFALDVKEKCTPMVVTLTNTSLNGTSFAWDYGHTIGGVAQKEVRTDKTAFDLTVDSESPNGIQTYPITLVTTDAATLCSATSTANLEVYPRVLPKFEPSATEGCSDLLVSLTNQSTGGDMSYAWAFGDGETAGTKDLATVVSHTYINRTNLTKDYSARLLATNTIGCKAEFTQVISAYPKVEAGFSFIQASKCTPFPIDIKNSSLNGDTFTWDFGHQKAGINRDTVTVDHNGFRTYIYNSDPDNAQTYIITLTAKSNEGCTSTVTKNITANPIVLSNFTLDVDRGCNPLTVAFDNLSTGAATYSWNLGNGNTSTLKVPASMVYTNNDTVNTKQFDISMVAKNADGCTSTTSKKVFVYPKIMAGFNLDKTQNCTPFQVNIANAYPSSAYSYEWDLGSNGQHTLAQLPTQTFLNLTPDYTVKDETIKLRVYYKNDASCYKEVSKTIQIYPRTRSDFKMDVVEACNPLVVNFSNTTESFNDKTSYQWKFAALGTSSEKNPQYTFQNMSHTDNATYNIQLKSTSAHGCTDSISRSVLVRPVPKAMIEIKNTSACAPFKVEIKNLSIGASPTNLYWVAENPTVVVTKNDDSDAGFTIDNLTNDTKASVIWHKIVSDFGCTDSISQVVYTYPYVTSKFDFSPEDKGCNPLAVNFKNQSVNADYFTWDFDDGITTSVDNPVYIFHNLTASDRIFNVKLNARSSYGCESTSSKDFTVYPAPMAYFTIDPQLRTYPDASFLMENKTSPMSPTWNYEWDFGDGKSYTGVNPPIHVYDTWAPESEDYKYYVTLKVNNGNCSDQLKQYLFLKPAVPIAIFDSSVGESCAPLVTQFSHEAVYYNSIEWDFGDGTTSTEDSPVHEYPVPGRYYVQLTVRGDGGVTYAYKTLYVHPNPSASFKFAPDEAMLPDADVHFYNTSTEGKTFYWDFGDHIGSSTEQNPVYKYKDLGAYDVRLTVTSENGCVDDTLLTGQVKVIGEGMLKFPNAFIPSTVGGNGGYYEAPDYKNEVFHPIYAGVVTYKMLIYNRWGERLFESNDPTVGWDGYYKGKLCEQGVYVYRAQGRYTNGKTFDIRGDVTLLR